MSAEFAIDLGNRANISMMKLSSEVCLELSLDPDRQGAAQSIRYADHNKDGRPTRN